MLPGAKPSPPLPPRGVYRQSAYDVADRIDQDRAASTAAAAAIVISLRLSNCPIGIDSTCTRHRASSNHHKYRHQHHRLM